MAYLHEKKGITHLIQSYGNKRLWKRVGIVEKWLEVKGASGVLLDRIPDSRTPSGLLALQMLQEVNQLVATAKTSGDYTSLLGYFKSTRANSIPTLSEIISLFISSSSVSESSKKTYEYSARAFMKSIGSDILICNLTFQQVVEHLSNYGEAETYNKHLSLLQRICEYATSHKYLDSETNKQVQSIKGKVTFSKTKALSQTDVIKILDCAKGNQCIYNIILTLVYTGMRIGEVLRLTFNQEEATGSVVNLDNSTIEIRESKTESGCRVIPLHPILITIFSDLLQNIYLPSGHVITRFNKGYLFCDKRGKALSRITVAQYLNKISKASGVEFSARNFRTTFGTNLYNSDCDIKSLQITMGHKSSKTTLDTYVKKLELRDSDKEKIINILDKVSIK